MSTGALNSSVPPASVSQTEMPGPSRRFALGSLPPWVIESERRGYMVAKSSSRNELSTFSYMAFHESKIK